MTSIQGKRIKRFALGATAWLRRYGITLLVLGVALLSARSVMAADGETGINGNTLTGLIGGIIASTIINLFTQRRNLRVESKADSANAQVKSLARELGVDDPKKATPDIVQMQTQINKLETDLTTVKNELVTTLEERDSARTAAAKQVEKNSEDNQRAQSQIDRLTRDRDEERQISARLEEQLRDYDHRFHEQELKMERIMGRLDQQGVTDSLGNTMQTVAKLLNDVSLRLTSTQPEGTAT